MESVGCFLTGDIFIRIIIYSGILKETEKIRKKSVFLKISLYHSNLDSNKIILKVK